MGWTHNYIFMNLLNLLIIGLLLGVIAIKLHWLVSMGLIVSIGNQYLITKHKDTFNV